MSILLGQKIQGLAETGDPNSIKRRLKSWLTGSVHLCANDTGHIRNDKQWTGCYWISNRDQCTCYFCALKMWLSFQSYPITYKMAWILIDNLYVIIFNYLFEGKMKAE